MFVQVCVIGAGVSGLKAAHTLLHHPRFRLSAQDVVVLEAQDHIGGRIDTNTTASKLGLHYDLGAAWFHDCLTNDVLHEYMARGAFDPDRDGYYDDRDVQFFASDADGPLDVDRLKLHRVMEDMERWVELYYHESLAVADVSLEHIVSQFLEKYRRFLTPAQHHYCGRMLRYLELWYGIAWDKISAKYAIMDHQGRNLYNRRGYQFLVDDLAAGVPVQLNQQVKQIDRQNRANNGYRICVHTATGQKVYCNYVVVTVPQSILQLAPDHDYGIKWVPELPATITDALSTIHFGALGKVVFEFDTVWWDRESERIEIIADGSGSGTGPDPQTDSKTIRPPNPDSDPLTDPRPFSYPAYVINYAAINPSSLPGSSLIVLTQAPLTQYLESNPHKAWTYFKPMLQKMVAAGRTITEPINTITTNWTNNPFIRGSYAAVEVNDDPSDLIIQLAAEFSGCGLYNSPVRFAGEHTILDGAGCVHGAYNSGRREAEWIINDLHPESSSTI